MLPIHIIKTLKCEIIPFSFYRGSISILLRLLICSFLTLTSCGAASEKHGLDNSVIRFIGAITETNSKELIAKIEEQNDNESVLIIDSAGGDGLAGIQIGRAIRGKNVTMIVKGVCLSACAQYLLPAARHVTITNGSIIGFHTSLNVRNILFNKNFGKNITSNAPAKIERDYYSSLGYSEDIFDVFSVYLQPVCLSEDKNISDSDPNRFSIGSKFSLFIPSPSQLRQVGISNVQGEWPSDNGLRYDADKIGFNNKFNPFYNPYVKIENVKISQLLLPDCKKMSN